jgi:hypothetical protein
MDGYGINECIAVLYFMLFAFYVLIDALDGNSVPSHHSKPLPEKRWIYHVAAFSCSTPITASELKGAEGFSILTALHFSPVSTPNSIQFLPLSFTLLLKFSDVLET